MAEPRPQWPDTDATRGLVLDRVAPEATYKARVYAALKQAILNMDLYGSPEPAWLDERQLAERLGVSRTPIREAVAMLEQQGFVRAVPRKGIVVLRKTKREVIEMIQAWAALEGMAARLVVERAADDGIAELRTLFRAFGGGRRPADNLSDYSAANIRFHQTIIALSGSAVLAEMTEGLLLHVRGIRQITIGRDDRASQSIIDHLGIIEALEQRDADAAERRARDHTLGLAAYVERHGAGIFE